MDSSEHSEHKGLISYKKSPFSPPVPINPKENDSWSRNTTNNGGGTVTNNETSDIYLEGYG